MITIPENIPYEISANASDKNLQLYATTREFEAIFTASMLKQGLKSAAQLSDQDSSNSSYMDFAHEQLANYLGRQGILGIADTIYKQMSEFDQGDNNESTRK